MKLPHQVIHDRLAIYLGPHTTKNALKTFAQKSLGVSAESITAAQAPALLDAMRPMLKTLLGAQASEKLLAQLQVELSLHQ